MKFLCLKIGSYLNWTNHIYKLIPKLSEGCYAVRSIFKSLYFAYFHSTVKYETIVGSDSSNSKKIFTLQNKTVTLMAGVKRRNS
jgi:hypothetical protein